MYWGFSSSSCAQVRLAGAPHYFGAESCSTRRLLVGSDPTDIAQDLQIETKDRARPGRVRIGCPRLPNQ